jgi:hypothetical protein
MEQELTQLKEEIQRKRNYNGQRFLGGYTEPAKRDYDAEEKRIATYEEERKKEIQEKYKDGKTVVKTTFAVKSSLPKSSGPGIPSGLGPGIPSVGGYAAFHAAAHGGGFNHPGHYGSPFQ